MKLTIVSHTSHYCKGNDLVGWGPTVREIDYLSELFDSVVHVAPVHTNPPPESAIAYSSPRVTVRPVPPAGGTSASAKLGVAAAGVKYVRAIRQELRNSDVVHIRCPANISLIACLLLSAARAPRLRWAKYAGNWRPEGREAWSYTFQRWWLNRGLHRGVVTVNGQWPGQPPHVYSFFNPCLTDQEVCEGRALGVNKSLSDPIRLLYVGGLVASKGVRRIIEILDRLQRAGISATLDLAGDGPERFLFKRLAADRGVGERITFHGWLPRPAIAPLYAHSHLLVFPSDSEGWPKVLSEGMAYGVVPVASGVSCIPQYLEQCKTGRTLPPEDVDGFAEAITWYAQHPEEWKAESENAIQAAERFSYAQYLKAVRSLLHLEA